jgi:predicted DNA-binding transcriptional regulator YafY
MARSTRAQKAERLNVAYGLLAEGRSMAEVATMLSQRFGLSRRQSYRYLREAQAIGHPVAVSEASVAITLKIPGSVARDLRAYANSSGLTIGEIVARAVSGFLTAAGKHG